MGAGEGNHVGIYTGKGKWVNCKTWKRNENTKWETMSGDRWNLSLKAYRIISNKISVSSVRKPKDSAYPHNEKGNTARNEIEKLWNEYFANGGKDPGQTNPDPGTGDPGTGDPGTGDPGSGDPGTGNPGSGNPGTGNPGSGDPGSGDPGSGNPGSGDPGSGDPGSDWKDLNKNNDPDRVHLNTDQIDPGPIDLDAMDFDFAGNPQKMEFNGSEPNPWVFSKLSQIIDYILGIFTGGIRTAIVGWTSIIERGISDIMHKVEEPLTGTANDGNSVTGNTVDGNTITGNTATGNTVTGNTVATTEPSDGTDANTEIYTIEDIVYNRVPILDANIFSDKAGGKEVDENSVISLIRKITAEWFVTVRNIMIIVLAILLVYAGVRMAISTVAETKANYKQYLIGWMKSIIVLFVVHYMFVLILNLNGTLVNVFQGDSSQENLIYETIRTRAYDVRFSIGFTGMLMYIVLIMMFVKFTWVYAKRFITIILLTIISPIVIGKYSFECASGRRSTNISKFIYMYASNVIIQSVHALLYTSLVGIALKLALNNITGFILALMFMSFMLSADKLLLRIFKFDNDIGDIRKPFNKKEELAGVYYGYGVYKIVKDDSKKLVTSATNTISNVAKTAKDIGASGVKAVTNAVGAGTDALRRAQGVEGDAESENNADNADVRAGMNSTRGTNNTGNREDITGKSKGKNTTKKPVKLIDKINGVRTRADRYLLDKSNKYLGKDSGVSQRLALKIVSRRKGKYGKFAKQTLKLRKKQNRERYSSEFKYIASEIKGAGSIVLAIPTMVFNPTVGVTLATSGISTIRKNGRHDKSRRWTTKQKIANAVTFGHYGNRVEAVENYEEDKKKLDPLVYSITRSNEAMENIEKEFEKYKDPIEREQAKNIMRQVISMNANVSRIKGYVDRYMEANSITNIGRMSETQLESMAVQVSEYIGIESDLDDEQITNIKNEAVKNIRKVKINSREQFAQIISSSVVTANVESKFINIALEANEMKEAEISLQEATKNMGSEWTTSKEAEEESRSDGGSETTYETTNGTTSETASETTNETANEATSGTTNETTNETSSETTNKTTNQTTSETASESTNKTTYEVTNETTSKTTNEATNKTDDRTRNSTGRRATSETSRGTNRRHNFEGGRTVGHGYGAGRVTWGEGNQEQQNATDQRTANPPVRVPKMVSNYEDRRRAGYGTESMTFDESNQGNQDVDDQRITTESRDESKMTTNSKDRKTTNYGVEHKTVDESKEKTRQATEQGTATETKNGSKMEPNSEDKKTRDNGAEYKAVDESNQKNKNSTDERTTTETKNGPKMESNSEDKKMRGYGAEHKTSDQSNQKAKNTADQRTSTETEDGSKGTFNYTAKKTAGDGARNTKRNDSIDLTNINKFINNL